MPGIQDFLSSLNLSNQTQLVVDISDPGSFKSFYLTYVSLNFNDFDIYLPIICLEAAEFFQLINKNKFLLSSAASIREIYDDSTSEYQVQLENLILGQIASYYDPMPHCLDESFKCLIQCSRELFTENKFSFIQLIEILIPTQKIIDSSKDTAQLDCLRRLAIKYKDSELGFHIKKVIEITDADNLKLQDDFFSQAPDSFFKKSTETHVTEILETAKPLGLK